MVVGGGGGGGGRGKGAAHLTDVFVSLDLKLMPFLEIPASKKKPNLSRNRH